MLYYTNCDHANSINGGWILHVHTDHRDYECPDGGTMLDSRAGASALTTQSHALRFGSSR